MWLAHGPVVSRRNAFLVAHPLPAHAVQRMDASRSVRFVALFERIFKYIFDFARCLEDLREGVYIQQVDQRNKSGSQTGFRVLHLPIPFGGVSVVFRW